MRSTLCLPKRAAETYTAHCTAISAVQSNEVYLPPCDTCALVQRRLGGR